VTTGAKAHIGGDGWTALAGAVTMTTALASTLAALPAMGQEGPAGQLQVERTFDIPAQALTTALVAFGQQSGIQVTVDGALVRDLSTAAVRGTMTNEQALRRLLAGTGLTYGLDGATIAIQRAAQQTSDGLVELGPVRVEADATGRFGDLPPEPGGFKADYQATATKIPLALRDTPQAISVVTRESIESRQALNLQTALETAGNITPGATGGGGTFAGNGFRGPFFLLRGQFLDADRDIRADGFAIASDALFDLAAIERVEVVKGPSGFYGQGSLGGFINLVRKKPQPDFMASAAVQAGSFDTYRGEVDLTGALTEDETIRGRIIGSYEDAGSFVDGIESDRAMASPSLEAYVGEKTRVLVQTLFQREEFVPNFGIPLIQNGNINEIPNISRSLLIGVPSREKSEAEVFDTTVRIDREIGDRWLASLLLQTSNSARDLINENYGYGIAANGNTQIYAISYAFDHERWAGELRLDGTVDAFGREHKVLFGLERNTRKDELVGGGYTLGIANIYAGNFASVGAGSSRNITPFIDQDTRSDNSAAYGLAVLNLTDKTKLLANIRFDRADQKQVNNLTGAIAKKTNQAWTMRFGITQELTENVSFYATYAESFNPVFNVSRSGILDPETGTGYEYGLKSEWFDDRLAANLSIYRQDLDNRPIFDPTNNFPLERFFVSAGRHRTDGIEIELAGEPYPGFTVAAAATWMKNRFIDPDDNNFGLRADDSIDHQFSLYANYELQSGPLQGLGIGASVFNVGKRAHIAGFLGGTQNYTPGYTRTDLHLSYNGFSGWDLGLQVRNVTDEVYIENSRSGGAQNYFGAPRSVLFRAKKSF